MSIKMHGLRRIVHLSDTHMLHRRLDVPAGDVLVHSGDFTGKGTVEDYDDVFDWLDSMPHKHKVLVAGNHDSLFQQFAKMIRKRVPKSITYLEDSGTTLDGLSFWGSPWTPGYPWMAFTYRAIERRESPWTSVPDDTDVLITHGPPHSILDRNYSGQRIGDVALYKRVEVVRPKLHLFGHVHDQNGEMSRFGTRFVNAAVGDDDEDPNLSQKIHVLDV
jgi:Icc-related predicted phosphoesterase